MTVTTTYAPVTATGDGSTVAFAFPYLVYQSSHLSITIDDVSTSAWTAATYGSASGVTVTFDTAPTNGAAIIIKRIVPYTQNTDLENFDGNPSDVTEKQFDLLAMADQQIAEANGRSILAPIGASLTTNEITGTIDSTTRVLTITTDGPATSTLGSLSTTIDTLFTSLATNDLLTYNGTNWINTTRLNLGIGVTEFADDVFRIQDNSDATKEIAFEASGITTGTTRTATMPDKSGTLAMISDIPVPSTRQYLTSGTAATYTTPTGCTAILVRAWGAGGGGGATITNNGASGGNTIFNAIEAAGGAGGTAGGSGSNPRAGGAGGSAGTGTATFRMRGNSGSYSPPGISGISVNGGNGGTTSLGGNGVGAVTGGSVGGAAVANSGAGGGGAVSSGSGNASAGGGGAGEYFELYISSPSATYTYTIGAAGAGGAAGTNAGGDGGSGMIIVEEFY